MIAVCCEADGFVKMRSARTSEVASDFIVKTWQ